MYEIRRSVPSQVDPLQVIVYHKRLFTLSTLARLYCPGTYFSVNHEED